MELLDSTERLVEAQSQIAKLQTCVDNIMKERVHRHFLALQYWLSLVGGFQLCAYLYLHVDVDDSIFYVLSSAFSSFSLCLCFILLFLCKVLTCMWSYFLQFGDLDPGSADFFLQEERIKQLRTGYEAQYRVIESKSQKSAIYWKIKLKVWGRDSFFLLITHV